ncbi:MAG: hypothetical protein H7Y86_15140 [Rhizobacter sp.]|nr:hypothetical protein [Ferruginibacter sp.]
MTERKNFNTGKAPRMDTIFPQAVVTNNFIFRSGMPGLDPGSGQVISSSFGEQTGQALENTKTLLEAAGSSMSKVVKTTLFMVAVNDMNIVNKIYQDFSRARHPLAVLRS